LSVLARYAQGSWRSRRKRELHRDAAKQAHSHAKLLVIRPFPLHLRTGRSGPLIRRRIGVFFLATLRTGGPFAGCYSRRLLNGAQPTRPQPAQLARKRFQVQPPRRLRNRWWHGVLRSCKSSQLCLYRTGTPPVAPQLAGHTPVKFASLSACSKAASSSHRAVPAPLSHPRGPCTPNTATHPALHEKGCWNSSD
jgi:hypothetical protein